MTSYACIRKYLGLAKGSNEDMKTELTLSDVRHVFNACEQAIDRGFALTNLDSLGSNRGDGHRNCDI
jgi:hypothetical protein